MTVKRVEVDSKCSAERRVSQRALQWERMLHLKTKEKASEVVEENVQGKWY